MLCGMWADSVGCAVPSFSKCFYKTAPTPVLMIENLCAQNTTGVADSNKILLVNL